ncbi:ATP-binding protein [Streptomyces monticola]|uniref:ATP-binding protein n=1 Tax=Streptomyces monticola TaxID=2666263 RepID=A0ABW2JEH5_9ACTN
MRKHQQGAKGRRTGRAGARRALVGRDGELAAVRGLLAAGRLVTVVGPAGVGKSSLAAAAVSRFKNVVRVACWEEGPERRPTLHALNEALGADPEAGLPAAVGLLRGRRVLVLLDDFDPVHAECIHLVQTLLLHVPGLRVLATGRQPLGLGDEQVLRLRALPVTAPDGGDGPAVELFLRRARAARRGFTAEGADRDAVRALCVHLEGMPLALVLAAAQVPRMAPVRLAQLIEAGQCWLRADELPVRRHRSLRAAMEAQYALCDRTARLVWARLSVARGDFALDAAVFLCQGGGVLPHDVPACLARLAAAAILEPVREAGGVLPPRYRMTRVARDFGTERLHAAAESGAADDRHLLWYSRLATTAHDLWRGGQHARATLLIRDEAANIQAALGRSPRDATQADLAVSMALDLWFWWAVCGNAADGRDVLDRLLPLSDETSPLRARVLCLTGWLAASTGAEGAEGLLRQAWTAAVMAGDVATVGHVAHVQGMVALCTGDAERALGLLREAVHMVPADPVHGPPAALSHLALGIAHARGGELAEALQCIRCALSQPAARRDLLIRSLGQYGLALVDHLKGRRSRAWRRANRALALATSLGSPSATRAIERLLTDIERGPSGPGGTPVLPPACGDLAPGAAGG